MLSGIPCPPHLMRLVINHALSADLAVGNEEGSVKSSLSNQEAWLLLSAVPSRDRVPNEETQEHKANVQTREQSLLPRLRRALLKQVVSFIEDHLVHILCNLQEMYF